MNIASAVARVPCQGIARKRRRSQLYIDLLCKYYQKIDISGLRACYQPRQLIV